ncbi:hypothetical protein Tco_0968494 [Tanacetum coccineum]
MLYDGSVITKDTNVISIDDSKEILMLEEESRSKMLLKQNFGKCFVPQQELSDEQAFWLQTLHPNTDQSASSPVKIEAPRELPKASLVNISLNKHKYYLNVVKKRITPDALTEGEWGFEHTKAVFLKEIILLLKTLKDIFNVFNKDLLNEVTEVQTYFNQMEAAVQQYSIDKQCFEIQKKQFLIENDRLLDQIISQDIVNIVVNSLLDINTSVNMNSSVAINDYVNYVEMCKRKRTSKCGYSRYEKHVFGNAKTSDRGRGRVKVVTRGTDNEEKDEKQSQNDKTGLGMEKTVKDKAKSKPERYVFVLNGGAVDWKSAKQIIFATSSAKAEYIAAFDASKEAVWVRKFISRLGVVPTIEKLVNMYCDNTGAIAIANESGIHYLRKVIEFGDIKLEKVHTDDNLADPFTKALAFPKHSELTRNIGMLPASSFM